MSKRKCRKSNRCCHARHYHSSFEEIMEMLDTCFIDDDLDLLDADVLLIPDFTNYVAIDELGWIVLDENISTGYHWSLRDATTTGYVLDQTISLYPNTHAVGVEGKKIFIFHFLKNGKYTIYVDLMKAGRNTPIKTLRYRVVVA